MTHGYKIKIRSWAPVAIWKWNVPDEDVCGICRNPFEACCPECKVPGDDCPLSNRPLLAHTPRLQR